MLITKLHKPGLSKDSIKRIKLFEKLNTGLQKKVTLISAPAGFGKSTLIADWIEQNKVPAAWFSIDKTDNDVVVFLNYVITAIQGIHQNFGKNTVELLASPQQINAFSIVGLLINDLVKIKNDFLLVLDDFHLIENKEISSLLAYLIEHLPEHVHLVLATRSDPNIPLARIRSQNNLLELRSADLSFSSAEIAEFFYKRFSIKLPKEEIVALHKKTEGWIAGVQLTALSIKNTSNISEFIHELEGDNRYIMDYLIEEVLKVQSDDIKEFLLYTSIFKQFSVALCNAVLERNDSREIIDVLEKGNMFIIPLDHEKQWYRFHHLFAYLLKKRLIISNNLSLTKIHENAFHWFRNNRMFELAIDHAIEIKNYRASISLLDDIAEDMWKSGKHEAILEYCKLIPDEILFTSPKFCLFYSWILIVSGRYKQADAYLNSAEKVTVKTLEDPNISAEENQKYTKLLGKIAVAYAYYYSHTEDSVNILNYCELAEKSLPEEDSFWHSWVWFSYGISYYKTADLVNSLEALKKSYNYAVKTNDINLIATVVIRLAETEQQLGLYKSAYEKCSQLLVLINNKGFAKVTEENWTYAAMYNVMGVTNFIWGNLGKALDYMQIAYDLKDKVSDAFLKSYIVFVYAYIQMYYERNIDDVEIEIEKLNNQLNIAEYLRPQYISWKLFKYIRQNELEKGNRFVEEYKLTPNDEITFFNKLGYLAYLRLLLVQNKVDDAETLISNIEAVSNEGDVFGIIEVKIAKAILYQTIGNNDKAVKMLMDAMNDASKENLLSFFIQSKELLTETFAQVFKIQATQKTEIPNSFITNLKKAFDNFDSRSKGLSDELSSRETDILKQLAKGLGNQEIGEALFISITTVKTHVRNILQKLDAKNRHEAVVNAKNKGLL